MLSDLLGRLGALAELGNAARNRLAALALVLGFFLAVFALKAFLRLPLSPSKVMGTLKLGLLGLALLVVEGRLDGAPAFQSAVGAVQGVVVLWCLANLVTYLLVDVYCWFRMNRQVPSFIRDLLTLLVYVCFALVALRFVFRLDVSSILTTTTVLTAAVAFAMQSALANMISGFYVDQDENLQRRSWIWLKEQGILGEIVNVGFRYVTVRTPDDQRVMVPNQALMQNVVHHLGTPGASPPVADHLKVGLSYDLPPDQAIALLTRVLQTTEHVAAQPAPTVYPSAFLDSAVEYDLKYYLEHWSYYRPVRGSILQRTWYAVTREGHSFPYPHREVIAKTAQAPFALDPDEVMAALRRSELLGALPEPELQALAEGARHRIFGKGEVVVKQGEEGASLFSVQQGTLEAAIDGATVGVLRPGDVFGEMSLLTGERRKATVTAADEVHLVELGKAQLEPLVRANPALLERLSAILTEREERNAEQKRRAELAAAAGSRKDAFLRKLRAVFTIEG
jgi:small-conductance mechanosensitive channel/CRP-like cAMP-binding protein